MPRVGRTGKVLSSLVVGGVFLFLAFRHVPLDELGSAFRELDARWFIPAIGLSLLLQVSRAWRWQLELSPLAHIPFGRLWVVTSVAYMAINLLPVRLGEVVRPWLLSRRSTLSFSTVVGNLIVEKTFDSAVIVFYILLGLLTTPNLPTWVRRGALLPAIFFVAPPAPVVLLSWPGGRLCPRPPPSSCCSVGGESALSIAGWCAGCRSASARRCSASHAPWSKECECSATCGSSWRSSPCPWPSGSCRSSRAGS